MRCPSMVADCEVFKIPDQPPPVIVESMSQSGHLYGIESKPYSIDGSMEFVARVHCMVKPFVVHDIIVSISSTPNCRSGQQKWLLRCPNVCLVTLTHQ